MARSLSDRFKLAASEDAQQVALKIFPFLLPSHNTNDLAVGKIDPPTVYASVLKMCGNSGTLWKGKLVHVHIMKYQREKDRLLGNLLIEMYNRCGSLRDAHLVFGRMHNINVFSWSILIAAYCQHGMLHEAKFLLLNMPQKNVVSWTTMISAFSQQGHSKDAMQLFQKMIEEGMVPDVVTFISIVDACGDQSALEEGKIVHAYSYKQGLSNVVLGNALINFYAKCSSLEDAFQIFLTMTERNVVSWTIMVTEYIEKAYCKEAFILFYQMQVEDLVADKVTFISIVDACATLAALENGKRFHALISHTAHEQDVTIGTALVHMYASCGSLEDAKLTFNKYLSRDLFLWNAMLAAYAQHGCGHETLELFKQMYCIGLLPDRVTLISLLGGCTHIGLFDEGCYYFSSMSQDQRLRQCPDAYACMISLLGHAGQLDQGEDIINTMYRGSIITPCTILLHACSMYGDMQRGKRLSSLAFELSADTAGSYVMLSNIYAAIGG